jgi:hypothetical protein
MTGVRLPAGQGLSVRHNVQIGFEAHPMGTVVFSSEVKRLERESDHSPPYSA